MRSCRQCGLPRDWHDSFTGDCPDEPSVSDGDDDLAVAVFWADTAEGRLAASVIGVCLTPVSVLDAERGI